MLMNTQEQAVYLQPPSVGQTPSPLGEGSDTVRYYFREALVAAQSMRGGNIVLKISAANQRLVQIGVEETLRNQIIEGLMRTLNPEQYEAEPQPVNEMMQVDCMDPQLYADQGERRSAGFPPAPPEMSYVKQDDLIHHARPQFGNISNPSTPSLGRLNLSSPSNAMRPPAFDDPQRSMDNYSEPSSLHPFHLDRHRSPHSHPSRHEFYPEGNSRSSLSDMPHSDQCLEPQSGTSYDSAGSDRHMGIQLGDKQSNSREKKPQKNVQQLQTLYVRYNGKQRADTAMHWSSSSSVRENDSPVPSSEPIAMSMAIVNAPAAMSLPCKPNKLFHPPFKIRVYVGYHHDLRYRCRVQAYVLCEQQVENLAIWVPETHGLGEGFDKGVEEHTFELTEEEIQRQSFYGRNSGEQRMMHWDFELSDMRFQSPSRMKKRWIVFVCNAPNNDLLLCLYKVPTVVVSRSIDQYNKALLILQGIVPKDGRSMRGKLRDGVRGLRGDDKLGIGEKISRTSFQNYVVTTYQAMDLTERMITEEDMAGLETIAGFPPPDATMDPESRDAETLTSEQWQAFESWWEACLKMLSNVRHLWLTLTPVIICSFSVDRDRATAYLVDKPAETFLIRISTTRPGCFVISRRLKELSSGKEQQEWVKHAVLHSQDVHDRAMETWIRDMQGVHQLLNVMDMQLVPKQDIFHTGYRRMNNAPSAQPGAQPSEVNTITFEMENAGYTVRLPPQPVESLPPDHMDMDGPGHV